MDKKCLGQQLYKEVISMNQRIKTFIITIMATLFAAIAIFGITTSLAEEVYDMYTSFNTTPTVNFDAETYSYKKGTTTINDIINAFNEGKTLTNISQEYRDKSSFIYCKERNWYLYPEGRYEVNKNKDGEILEEQFPGTDPKGGCGSIPGL